MLDSGDESRPQKFPNGSRYARSLWRNNKRVQITGPRVTGFAPDAVKLFSIIALCVGCAQSPALRSTSLEAIPAAERVQLVVWNRSGVPVLLQVMQDDSLIIDSEIRWSSIPQAIDAARVLRMSAAGIALTVSDKSHASSLRKSYSRSELAALETPVIAVTITPERMNINLQTSLAGQ